MTGTMKNIRVYVAKSKFLWVGVVFIPQSGYDFVYADNTPFVKTPPDIAIGYTAFTKKRLMKKINKRIKKEITK